MQALTELPESILRRIRGVLTDVDDTLTTGGRLTARTYAALERLQQAGLTVIPITGGPAGWCDLIARLWPVDGVIGENGAFYFHYDRRARRLRRRFVQDETTRRHNRERLMALQGEILAEFPDAAAAPDQNYRECDLAIDYAADMPTLPPERVAAIVERLHRVGASAKVSSIHVNAWFGDYDKLSTVRLLLAEVHGVDLDAEREAYLYVGDAPNDEPMFTWFPYSVGVANIHRFAARMNVLPTHVTVAAAGDGFVELAERLLAARSRQGLPLDKGETQRGSEHETAHR